MVHPEIWEEIPDKHVVESVGFAEKGENSDGNGETNVTQENEFGILGFVQRAGWVEMVDSSEETVLLARTVLVVASHVAKKVQWPAEKLLTNRMNKSRDRGLLGQFVKFMGEFSNARSIFLTGLWDENHISIHVSSGLVVLAVGDLPGEVWYKKCRVTDPSSCVIKNLRGRERLVATFVSKNP